MKNRKITIEKNLATLRKINRVSLEEVGQQIGVSRQTIAKWEAGETLPDLVNCASLADYFDVSLEDLLYFDEEQEQTGIGPKGKHICGMSVLQERGQIVIPKQARSLLNLKAGQRLVVLVDENPGTMGIALIPCEQFMQTNEEITKQLQMASLE